MSDNTTILQIFAAQYFLVLLLGLQSLNIRDGKKLYAALTSAALSVNGWLVTGITAQAYSHGMFSAIFVAFVVAGPLGIVTSMFVYGGRK